MDTHAKNFKSRVQDKTKAVSITFAEVRLTYGTHTLHESFVNVFFYSKDLLEKGQADGSEIESNDFHEFKKYISDFYKAKHRTTDATSGSQNSKFTSFKSSKTH